MRANTMQGHPAKPRVLYHSATQSIAIEGCTRLLLWHMPLDEAQRMTEPQLGAEFKHAAELYDVRQRDLWDVFRKSSYARAS